MSGRLGAACAWVVGCAGDPGTTKTADHTASPPFTPPVGGVVTLSTRDGETLEADYVPAEGPAPAVVLLHMVPPANDRTNWPPSFLAHLADAGYAVLAVDRRGAGGSTGDPVDAYEGPAGKYDVEACALRLDADGYGPIAVFGASNGTTSMIDYAVWAGAEGLPEPAALGFLTGGTYTENQTAMTQVPPVPAVFTTSTAEAAWTDAQRALDPGSWVFHEYPDGAHGTLMFDAAPEVDGDLLGFLVDVLPAE